MPPPPSMPMPMPTPTAAVHDDEAYRRLATPTTTARGSPPPSGAEPVRPALVRRRTVMFAAPPSSISASATALPTPLTSVDEERELPTEALTLSSPHSSSSSSSSSPPLISSRQRRASSSSSSAHSTDLLSDPQRWFARMDPHRDLHRLTNRFRDARMEESYQLYSSMTDFPVARRILLFLVAGQLVAYIFFLTLQHACLGGDEFANTRTFAQTMDANTTASGNATILQTAPTTSCHKYNLPTKADRDFLFLLWGFAPLALLYGLFPLQYLEATMRLRIAVYYIRRRWKLMAMVIVLLWAIGLDLYLHQLLFAVRTARQKALNGEELSCAKDNHVPQSWSAQSGWWERYPWRASMSVKSWLFLYQSRVVATLIMGLLAVVATVAGIVSVAVKLDFRHVLFNSLALWGSTLAILMKGPSFSLNSRSAHTTGNSAILLFSVLFPTSLTLLATYSEERAARMAYASKVRAERINTTLKLDLSIKRMGLEHRNVPKDERALLEEELLRASDTGVLRHVQIPFGELVLQDVVAKSASADVLLADYHGTQVVLKRLPLSECTAEGLRSFKDRVEMLAFLRHPNIVLFLGATYDNLANVGLVLEYLERGDVFTLLRSSMALSWSDPLLKIATDVALGVSYLHNCDPPLVHRDLKSSNLLCTTTYSCKISDFGESKRQHAAGALLSTLVGTPYWLAPEILREERYDVQVDCYSFGIVLIELETRKDPYDELAQAQSTIDIMVRVANKGLRPVIPASCPPRRRQLIERCLDADPRQRPRMTEIVAALQGDVRQELMEQTSFEPTNDRRRVMLMQRHQMLNRRGVQDLLTQGEDEHETMGDGHGDGEMDSGRAQASEGSSDLRGIPNRLQR